MLGTKLFSAVFSWYRFAEGSRVICISRDGKTDFLKDKNIANRLEVTTADPYIEEVNDKADYIIADHCLELEEEPTTLLRRWHDQLTEHGILLFTMNNRFGIRNFCGDKDPYTFKCFDAIDNYRYSYLFNIREGFRGRCYAKSDVSRMMKDAGFQKSKFYGVFPGLECPSYLLSENYKPEEDLSTRIGPIYRSTHAVVLDEKLLYPSLSDNDLLYQMANAYFIECSKGNILDDALQITISMDRSDKYAFSTIIRDKTVEKSPVYLVGMGHSEEILWNERELARRGVSILQSTEERGTLKQRRIEAQTGQVYLEKLFYSDIDSFIAAMDFFRNIILQSSEHVNPDDEEYLKIKRKRQLAYERRKETGELPKSMTEIFEEQEEDEGIILRFGFIELVPLNSFYMDGTFVFYDQEYVIEYCPANMIINRMIATFYSSDYHRMRSHYSDTLLLERYGLNKNRLHWEKMEWNFLDWLKNRDAWEKSFGNIKVDVGDAYANRSRLQYHPFSEEVMYNDIFEDTEGKDIYIFGTGKYANSFMEKYGDHLAMKGFLDNDPVKEDSLFWEIPILRPEKLARCGKDYIIYVCVKNYYPILEQLDSLGLYHYRIYSTLKNYNFKIKNSDCIQRENNAATKKTYKTGYVAGAFDLFHIGHVNLLRRAKEKCEYLVAGVMSDEKMYDLKKKMPVIPCSERMQVISSCRYVDEVIELPIDRATIRDAYEMVRFDCMFSGDDHANDTGWLAEREYLRSQGSDIVFFSYTKENSSSAIRGKI